MKRSTVFQKLPIVTLGVSMLAIAQAWLPAWHDVLVYDRTAIAAGEVWRLITGHLLHWNVDHLVWDVAMFAVLGAAIESRNRGAMLATFATATLAISAILWTGTPRIEQYRGLSGVDSALFVLAALLLRGEARSNGRPWVAGLLLFGLLAFVMKVGCELMVGTTWFVDAAAAGFQPLPVVHVIGGLVGVAVWLKQRAVGPSASKYSEANGNPVERRQLRIAGES